MLRIALVALAALALGACGGGPDWNGNFSGTLALAGATCSDGSAFPSQSQSDTGTFTRNGSTVSFGLSCGATETITLDSNNDSIGTVNAVSCPQQQGSDATTTLSITGGSASIAGDQISISEQVSVLVVASGASGTCNTTGTFTLNRVK